MPKSRISGKVVWIGRKEYKGKVYWRVGLLPDGSDNVVFVNSYLLDPPGQKGDYVTLEVSEKDMEKVKALPTKKKENSNTEERINMAVALKAAAEAITAAPHLAQGCGDVASLARIIKDLADELATYLSDSAPF